MRDRCEPWAWLQSWQGSPSLALVASRSSFTRPIQKSPATTAVIKLMMGRTRATTNPKKALVTKIESAPVSGAVIRKDMQDERDAPLLRISATTGTTEQLHSGTGTPIAELVATAFRLSSRSQRSMAWREMNTWIRPERNSPSNSMGANKRKDDQRKSKKRANIPKNSKGTPQPPKHWIGRFGKSLADDSELPMM